MKKRLANVVSWSFMMMVPLLFLSCTGPSSNDTQEIAEAAESKVPPEVMEAAQEGLKNLPRIVPNTPEEELTISDFFLIHTINPKAIQKAKKWNPSMIESTGAWQAMVFGGKDPYLMMTISKKDKKWKTTVYGYNHFANELSQVREAWPKENGFQLRPTKIYQLTADLIQVVQKGQEVGFVPLSSANKIFGMPTGKFDPTAVLAGPTVLKNSQKALAAVQLQ